MDEPTRITRHERESFRDSGKQVAAGVVAIIALIVAMFLFPGSIFVTLGLFTAAVGGVRLALSLRDGGDDELPPASPAFRALADPTRPLGEFREATLPEASAEWTTPPCDPAEDPPPRGAAEARAPAGLPRESRT